MNRTRIKICGITRVADALACAECGVDAIGLVFYPSSKRHINVAAAREIAAALPPFVTVVGLFVDPAETQVKRVLSAMPLDTLQFHGRETPAFCRQFGHPYIKAVAMGDSDKMNGENPPATPDFARLQEQFHDAAAFLLDSHGGGATGGCGRVFDWRQTPTDIAKPIILAGGITPANVHAAIAATRPYAVDCSSGVESAPGVKAPDKIRQLVDNVTHACKDH